MNNQDSEAYFDGDTYEPDKDQKRLNTQFKRVFNLMKDEQFRFLCEIAHFTHGSEASVSARLRDFRKERFGSHTVNLRRFHGGIFEYQLIPKPKQEKLF